MLVNKRKNKSTNCKDVFQQQWEIPRAYIFRLLIVQSRDFKSTRREKADEIDSNNFIKLLDYYYYFINL